MAIDSYNRECKFTSLKPYCHLAKDDGFVEYCGWWNGEGFDVTINNKTYSFTNGEFECILTLHNYKEK